MSGYIFPIKKVFQMSENKDIYTVTVEHDDGDSLGRHTVRSSSLAHSLYFALEPATGALIFPLVDVLLQFSEIEPDYLSGTPLGDSYKTLMAAAYEFNELHEKKQRGQSR